MEPWCRFLAQWPAAMRAILFSPWLLMGLTGHGYADTADQALSDAHIQAAIDKGQSTTTKALSRELKQKAVRVSRGDFGAPVELDVTFLSDVDRIALAAAEAKRQLREFSVVDAKKLPSGVMVLLEASAIAWNSSGVPNWSENGGVHAVLKVGGKIFQPLEKKDAGDFYGLAHWWLPTSQIVIARTWFTFPELPNDIQALTVTVISGTGKTKEKQVRSEHFR